MQIAIRKTFTGIFLVIVTTIASYNDNDTDNDNHIKMLLRMSSITSEILSQKIILLRITMPKV